MVLVIINLSVSFGRLVQLDQLPTAAEIIENNFVSSMTACQKFAQFHDICQISSQFLFLLLFSKLFFDQLSLLLVKFGIEGHRSLQIGANVVLCLLCENVVDGEIR